MSAYEVKPMICSATIKGVYIEPFALPAVLNYVAHIQAICAFSSLQLQTVLTQMLNMKVD